MNSPQSLEQLCSARCVPCEGGVPKLTADEIAAQIVCLPQWEYVAGPDRIRRTWKVRNFLSAMEFFQKVSVIAEEQAHHPDLHLVQYRNVTVEIWTHAIQGLSLNDFILAARIDRIPIS